jgi:hypothetical protein
MILQKESEEIVREESDAYVSYILKNTQHFSPIEFKVLGSQNIGCLPCVQKTFNGKVKLVYPIAGYRRLDRVLQSMNRDTFKNVMIDLLIKIKDVRDNSFLKVYHLDLSQDRIFIDWQTFEMVLVYLPIADNLVESDDVEFETALRSNIIRWSEEILPGERELLKDFREQMRDYNVTLRDICNGTHRNQGNCESKELQSKELQSLELQFVGNGNQQNFRIGAEPFILGRSQQRSDGHIDSRQVGNTHCRIISEGGRFYVIDLNSRNGTYLNGTRLPSQQPCILSHGDMLLLADTGFKVQMQSSGGWRDWLLFLWIQIMNI